MGVIDAPQWLLPAFTRSVKAIGATQPPEAIGSAGELLIERWSTPDRRFHNLRHLIDMLARVDELAEESHNPDIMRVACWYHGCVFSSDVEEVSRGNTQLKHAQHRPVPALIQGGARKLHLLLSTGAELNL